ncbi:MAG: helix-turn-helix transcriptional regulator [Sulfurovum sp.]|nr:helix-turn-helix transcriptional regulator [Sulfurovum sp.]
MEIKNTEILHKIIDLQLCIIEGKPLKVILRKYSDYFLTQSGSDIITIYMHENKEVKPEYILEKDGLIFKLLKKYLFDKKSFRWDKFLLNCVTFFPSGTKYIKITDHYQIFKGFLSKREAASFTKELQMKSAIIMPIFSSDKKEKIGYICFAFQSNIDPDMQKLHTVKYMLENIICPLYCKEHNSIYSKCIRIDEEMTFLTPQEKKIAKEVIKGRSYPEIAKKFDISINTLKTHMKNIFNKYNVSSKIELYNKLNTLDQ